MAQIVIDARDAAATEIRGWGRYTRELVSALHAGAAGELDVVAIGHSRPGPEFVFEQAWLPLLLKRRGAALVHAPNCFLPLIRPCPGVVTINDLAFETWPEDFAPRTRAKFRLIARLAARSAQRIICPSRFTAADVCRRYGVDPGKVRVIADAPSLARHGLQAEASDPEAHGLQPEASDPEGHGLQPGKTVLESPYLLAVGDLRRKKNLRALVEAFARVREAGGLPHRLVLAGVDCGEGPRLLELAREAPVELTGYVADARLDALIGGAELVVHPSLYEGFGLVVLEAMARGTPVLAARATALPETAGDAAAYFDPSDPFDLDHQLRSLLGDRARLTELSVLGRARAEQFSWERTARETADVYRELL